MNTKYERQRVSLDYRFVCYESQNCWEGWNIGFYVHKENNNKICLKFEKRACVRKLVLLTRKEYEAKHDEVFPVCQPDFSDIHTLFKLCQRFFYFDPRDNCGRRDVNDYELEQRAFDRKHGTLEECLKENE